MISRFALPPQQIKLLIRQVSSQDILKKGLNHGPLLGIEHANGIRHPLVKRLYLFMATIPKILR